MPGYSPTLKDLERSESDLQKREVVLRERVYNSRTRVYHYLERRRLNLEEKNEFVRSNMAPWEMEFVRLAQKMMDHGTLTLQQFYYLIARKGDIYEQ